MFEIPKHAAIFLFLLLTMRVHGQSSSTVAPTTVANTTVAVTTVTATTVANASTTTTPTTVATTTNISTTSSPTTVAPTTVANANCTDSPTCSGLSSVACRFPSLVTACPLLCHRNSSCAITDCIDSPTCLGLTSDVCRFPSLVTACPLLCHRNSSCSISEGNTIRTSFRLTNEVYNNNLANPSSTEFTTLKNNVQNTVRAALIQELGNRFVSIVVTGFTSGSVIVGADITVTDEDNSDSFEIVSKAIAASGVSGVDPSSVKVGVCSDGFVNVNNQCLMFSKLRLTKESSSTACAGLNGKLVVPTDFQKMASYIIKNNLFYWQYWVGASDESTPGTYKWNDGTPVDSSLWYPGYPPIPGTKNINQGHSCVKLHPNSNTDNGLIAAWDSNCDSTNTYRYICEEL